MTVKATIFVLYQSEHFRTAKVHDRKLRPDCLCVFLGVLDSNIVPAPQFNTVHYSIREDLHWYEN